MGVYNVGVREVHVATVEVEIDGPLEKLSPGEKADVLKMLAAKKHEELEIEATEFSHTLDRSNWSIEKVR